MVAASAAEQAGADAVICARSPVGPVVLALDGEERRIAAPVICDVDEARPVDWVLLATQAQQTPQGGPCVAPVWPGSAARAPWSSCCKTASTTSSEWRRSRTAPRCSRALCMSLWNGWPGAGSCTGGGGAGCCPAG